jgi:xanthine dehydrogenase accessory factor
MARKAIRHLIMASTDFYQTVLELKNTGSRFVTATVVSRRAPVSSHLGDRALIFADGRMQGFVGGSCSREIVRKQALEALQTGKPRLVLIRPDASFEQLQHASDAEGIVVPMTCASEGAVDVYLEPHTPAPLLLVAGFTPVAEAVSRMAALLEYKVVRIVTREELRDCEPNSAVALPALPVFLEKLSVEARASLAAVVATQGHYDEPVLEALLLAEVGFISLLSSRKRAVTVRELLELQGVPPEKVALIRNPAGLDINAKTPAEVAVSILAEIIQARDSSRPMFTNSRGYQKPEIGNVETSQVTGRIQARVSREVLSYEHLDSPLKDMDNDFRRGELYVRPATEVGNDDLSLVTGRIQDLPLQDVGNELQTHMNSNDNQMPDLHGLPATQSRNDSSSPDPAFAISPVDGERIEIVTAIHFADYNGSRYYFTCANCKRRFLKDPSKFLSVNA